MKPAILLGFLFFLVSCQTKQTQFDNKTPLNSGPAIQNSNITKANSNNAVGNTEGIIYSSDVSRIIGDTTIDRKKIYYSEVRFEPFIYFDDFKASKIYRGEKSSIDYNSNNTAKRYRTAIKENYKQIDFAGFYTFVSWGCGAPCQESALVDWRDGKVYDGPIASLGYDYRINSRMLIVNPPDSNGFYTDCLYCKPQIFVWNENKKIFYEMKRKK